MMILNIIVYQICDKPGCRDFFCRFDDTDHGDLHYLKKKPGISAGL